MSDYGGLDARTIILIGKTGNGKSALANVISGQEDLFKEGMFSVSETKNHQSEVVTIDGIRYRIVDTIGIGDTQLSAQEVLYKIAEACYTLRNGLHQVIFVIHEKFTKEEFVAYDLLRTVIFDPSIVRFTTIVRTRFSAFREASMVQQDIDKLKSENADTRDVIVNCNKVLHVNNLNKYEDKKLKARKECGDRIRLHLRNCREIYRPQGLDQLNGRISSYMNEKDKLEKLLIEIKQKLQESEKATKERIEKLEIERKLNEQQILSLKELVTKETGIQIYERSPGYFEKWLGIGLVVEPIVELLLRIQCT